MLKFITSSKGKFEEMQMALDPLKIKRVEVDLDEIQELDPYKIIKHKLKEAFRHHQGDFLIDDTGLYYAAFKYKLPGPLVKWFLDATGNKGLYETAKKMGSVKAELRTIIAYAKSPKQVLFFEARTKGTIVKPRGGLGFGIDPVFKPTGSKNTLAQMGNVERLKYGPRCKAAQKLKRHLLK